MESSCWEEMVGRNGLRVRIRNKRWQELLDVDRSVTMCATEDEAKRIYTMPLKFRALAVSVNIALRDWWAYSPQEVK